MKKITYVFLIAFMIVCFSGCNKNKWNKTITCTAEEKENIYCNYNFDPVCGDDGQTYWNACVACASNNISSYKVWECQICDDETGICSLWDTVEYSHDEWEYPDQEIKEVFLDIPTPNFD